VVGLGASKLITASAPHEKSHTTLERREAPLQLLTVVDRSREHVEAFAQTRKGC
jgi:hypothetical protein